MSYLVNKHCPNNNNINMRSVLVLYTGGTIGMQKNEKGVYSPVPNAFINKIKSDEDMHNEDFLKAIVNCELPNNLMVIHSNSDNITILYEIIEYFPLLDSSNMSIPEWLRIANDIEKNYDMYDGFVVLHGTDTLAYTSSILSYILEGLRKPVIVTGSQIPIYEPLSDAKDNFYASLMFAVMPHIQEVCVCFANCLLRGNRTVKRSSEQYAAFSSPNYPMLGTVGITKKVCQEYLWINKDDRYTLTVRKDISPCVAIFTLFPTISAEMVRSFVATSVRGIVLLTYGIGNIPNNKELLNVLEDAVRNLNIIIVNISQCHQGTVCTTYETGQVLESIGILTGFDMTPEAALTKLAYVIGNDNWSLDYKKKMMQLNIRGELTC